MSKYVDDYNDNIPRAEVKCPYCGGLHLVSVTAYSWGCRDCGNDFIVPLLAKIPMIGQWFTLEGIKEK